MTYEPCDRVEDGQAEIDAHRADVIDSVRDVSGDDFTRLFEEPVVLELTDVSGGAGKLLGIQVDMNYE